MCLILPCVALLWVPLYAGEAPSLLGVPLFYWYQPAWVILTPALMGVAFLLGNRARRAR